MAAAASVKEHLRFCHIDGWSELKSARGRGRDHLYFVKELEDGRTLRTKVSHGTKKSEYGAGLWQTIWKEELALGSEEEFWAVLKERRPARRDLESPAQRQEELPVWLVQRLLYSVGLREADIAGLSLEEATRCWQEWQMAPALSSLDEAGPAPEGKPALASLHAQAKPTTVGEERLAVGF